MSDQTKTKDETTPPVPAPEAANPQDRQSILQWVSERGIFVFTAVLLVFGAVFIEGFFSVNNFFNIIDRAGPVGIVALGMTFVVISGNYLDLSVVAQVATGGVVLLAVSNSNPLWMAFLAMLGVALVYALVNGIAVGYFKANAVIVTLSTTFIGLGLLRWLSNGKIFFGPEEGPVRAFGQAEVLGVPLTALLLVAMALILAFVLSRTTFGFEIRAFGTNEEATRLSGVNTGRLIVGAFLVTSIAAGVAGFALTAFSNTAVSSMSDGFEFQALAAIIIGGTSVFGGKGSVLRTLLGVIFVSMLTNIMILLGFAFGWQQLAIGVLIVVAVSVDTLVRRTAKS